MMKNKVQKIHPEIRNINAFISAAIIRNESAEVIEALRLDRDWMLDSEAGYRWMHDKNKSTTVREARESFDNANGIVREVLIYEEE